MKTALRNFSVILLLTFSFLLYPSAFAAQEVPKKGDVIQLLIGGYAIEAQVISITAPTAPSSEPVKKTDGSTDTTDTENPDKSIPNISTIENIQDDYNSFAESNPIKTGIENFQNTVNDQVAKWYQLATNKAILPKTAAIKDAKIDPRALFAGLAIIGAIILFWLFRRSRKRHYNYENDSSEEE